ncbi:MAG: DUF4423 domain-containing protein [Bdellovibrionaceae bacterium]|nr:DUF4423 domain-containing protein [Pseudobdellovibrionaceae bacterium]
MVLYRTKTSLQQLNYEGLARLTHPSEGGRLPMVLLRLQKEGFDIRHIEQAVFAPRPIPTLRRHVKMTTLPGFRKGFVVPFLRALRGSRTLAEVASILETKTLSTYHHWETGRRDIPLSQFYKAIDMLSGRLPALLETLGLEIPQNNEEFKEMHVGRYAQFFSDPWTPTVLMALRLPQVLNLMTPALQAQYLSQALKIPRVSIDHSMDLLMKLQLIRLQAGRMVSNPVQFDAIPSISSEKIKEIHQYWFNQAGDLLMAPGFHKLEQHALTHESKEKIISWISELRERIHQEVSSCGEPETLIHINWQVAELMRG